MKGNDFVLGGAPSARPNHLQYEPHDICRQRAIAENLFLVQNQFENYAEILNVEQ